MTTARFQRGRASGCGWLILDRWKVSIVFWFQHMKHMCNKYFLFLSLWYFRQCLEAVGFISCDKFYNRDKCRVWEGPSPAFELGERMKKQEQPFRKNLTLFEYCWRMNKNLQYDHLFFSKDDFSWSIFGEWVESYGHCWWNVWGMVVILLTKMSQAVALGWWREKSFKSYLRLES